MIEIPIYVDREDIKVVEEEQRGLFIRELLELFEPEHPEFPTFDELWPPGEASLPVKQRIVLRKFLAALNIEIIDTGDREVEIYLNGELVAKWCKPFVQLHKDMKQRTPAKRVFAELTIRYWTKYDDQGEA
jgi:hypothetical protein